MATVLVAEDDPDICLLEVIRLRQAGHTVLATHDGKTALLTALAEHPDVAVLDHKMPGMTGLDVCRALKADPASSDIAVIFLTAHTDEAEIEAGVAAGAAEYLLKPFGLRDLVTSVQAVLDRRERDPAASASSAARLSSLAASAAYRSNLGPVARSTGPVIGPEAVNG